MEPMDYEGAMKEITLNELTKGVCGCGWVGVCGCVVTDPPQILSTSK